MLWTSLYSVAQILGVGRTLIDFSLICITLMYDMNSNNSGSTFESLPESNSLTMIHTNTIKQDGDEGTKYEDMQLLM